MGDGDKKISWTNDGVGLNLARLNFDSQVPHPLPPPREQIDAKACKLSVYPALTYLPVGKSERQVTNRRWSCLSPAREWLNAN